MDGNKFDTLVRRFHRGEIGRRQFITGSLALAVGVSGATRLARAQDANPTSTPSSVQGQPGESGQQFPCPEPTDPFGWICGNGPFIPWYPIIAPPDITAASGIRWYGFQGMDDGSLRAEAFDRAGKRVSYYHWYLGSGGGTGWTIGADDIEMEGSLNPPRADGSQVEVSGDINGSPFRFMVDQNGSVVPDADRSSELDPNQQRLLELWQPAVERLDSLMDLVASSGDDPFAASDFGCFMAGAIAVPSVAFCAVNPAGCVIAGGAGGYIIKNCDSW